MSVRAVTFRVGQQAIHKLCIYSDFCRDFVIYRVLCSVFIRLWPTLVVFCHLPLLPILCRPAVHKYIQTHTHNLRAHRTCCCGDLPPPPAAAPPLCRPAVHKDAHKHVHTTYARIAPVVAVTFHHHLLLPPPSAGLRITKTHTNTCAQLSHTPHLLLQ